MNPYVSEIEAITLYPRSNEETKLLSNIVVKTKDLHSTGQEPYPGGPNDLHMGTTNNEFKCLSCHNIKLYCPGHSGSITLKCGIYSPLFAKYIRQYAKIFCHRCGNLSITKISKNPSDRLRLSETVTANNSNKFKICPTCSFKNPHVIPDPNNPIGIIAVDEIEGKDGSVYKERVIYPNEMYKIFDRIKDEDLARIGKRNSMQHPRNFIIKEFFVPAITVRPETMNVGGGRSRVDDITNLVQTIVSYNDNLPDEIPDKITPEMTDLILSIDNLSLAIYEMIKGTKPKDKKRMVGYGKKAQASLASRMPRKYGRIRRNLMGSRATVTSRSFITDDNSLEIDVVGVPIAIAMDIPIKEVVREYNREILMVYFQNGLDRYPGCVKVTKAKTGKTHAIGYIPDDFELEDGDIVWRHLINGDVAQFNRQPSLLPSNISANRVKILMTGGTFRLNAIACALYNADFDGDAMNMIFAQSMSSMSEISMLSSVEQRFITFNGSPAMGMFQDALIGIAKLTRNYAQFDKFHAMQMFGQIEMYPNFKREHYLGRDLVSKIFPEINYKNKPKFYEPGYAHLIKYEPEEISVVVRAGKLISGVLDKATVGQGTAGGILHVIHNEYGPRIALDVTYRLQQITTAYLQTRGCTIGIRDMILPKKILETEIFKIISHTIHGAELITDRLDKGQIVPPLGKSTSEHYEELVLNQLQHGDEFVEPVIRNMDMKNNEFYDLVSTGSKGDIGKILSCVSAIGQVTIAGARPSAQFGYKRTLVYFTKYDTHPRSRGYIVNSYMSGLSVPEFVFHCMDARYALIQKGLSVSITGEQGRKAIKNLESNIVDNHFRITRSSTSNIVQLNYGDDNLDPRYVEKVSFPTVMMTESDFEKKYRINSTKHKSIFDAEFAQLKDDRNFYRDLFMQNEKMSGILFNDKKPMPVNVERVITNIITKYNLDEAKEKVSPNPEAINMIKSFCSELPYVFMNNHRRKLKKSIPERLVLATYLFQICIRSHLCTANLIEKNINIKALKMILDRIYAMYSKAVIAYGTAVGIIAAQSISEPMTQMVLDSHHRSGGTGSKTTGIDRLKEIFGAKDTGIPTKKKDSTATMELLPIAKYLNDKEKVTEIANHIEMIPLKTFVSSWQIFFEKFGEPIHSKFKHEKSMIENFIKKNPLLVPPADLTKWCLRIVLLKEKLIFKHMNLDTIVHKLRKTFDGIYIVYSVENSDEIVLRIYRQSSAFSKKDKVVLANIEEFRKNVLDMIVRGIAGIRAAVVGDEQKTQSYSTPDGAITTRKVYAISCTGSNVVGVLQNNDIDPDYIQTDNIIEIERIYGIEAARYAIINQVRHNIGGLNYRHYALCADEMTYTGKVTPIERSGLGARDIENIMLRASNEAPIDVLTDAAANAMTDILSGVSAPLTMGKAPRIGSIYNTLAIDQEAVRNYRKTVDAHLEELSK